MNSNTFYVFKSFIEPVFTFNFNLVEWIILFILSKIGDSIMYTKNLNLISQLKVLESTYDLNVVRIYDAVLWSKVIFLSGVVESHSFNLYWKLD